MMAMATPAQFPPERLPVWCVLSEFFLDTELQENDYKRIAAILAKSPYTPAQLEDILRHEVYPVCRQNLLCPAGEWVAFDEQWLAERLAPLCGKKSRWPPPQLHAWTFKRHWEKLQPMLDALRETSQGENVEP